MLVFLNKMILKIGYSRICACTKIPVFCLPPSPADENKGSRPSLISVANRVIVIVFKCVRRSELVAPNSNSSNKDISMQFRDIGDRCCNFAERDEIFQFLKLSSKACQPSELRYFGLKI